MTQIESNISRHKQNAIDLLHSAICSCYRASDTMYDKLFETSKY